MQRYKLYRHPSRGDLVLPAQGLGALLVDLLGREDRLLREGYRDVGVIDAHSEREALARSTPASAQPRVATVRPAARPAGPRPQTPTPRSASASTPRRSTPPAATPSASSSPAPATPRPGQPPDLEALLRAVLNLPAASLARLIRKLIGGTVAFLIGIALLTHWLPGARVNVRTDNVTTPTGRYSPWLEFDALAEYTAGLDTRRYRIDAVEGRWHEGSDQCRVRYAQAPSYPHRWYWWCSQTEADFERLKAQYAAEGYTLVQQQSYARDDGEMRYSGAWLRGGERRD